MKKIINFKKIKQTLGPLKRSGEKIVLVGGCFDILHFGHIKFLEAAKKAGNILIVALENDQNVQRLKGRDRPFNTQLERAEILSHISDVDFVVLLPPMDKHEEYAKLVKTIHPDVIALTDQDKYAEQKRKQAEDIGAKFTVIDKVQTYSSSKLAKLLGLD